MLKFLIGSGGRDEETMAITNCKSANYACSSDRGVDDWNDILKLGLEC